MKVICPRCHNLGTLKVRTIRNNTYIIVDHGNTQHSLGSINELDLIIEQLTQEFKTYILEYIRSKIRKY